MSKSLSRKILIAFVAIIVILSYVVAIGLYLITIVDWWVPLAVAVPPAVASSLLAGKLWSGLTGSRSALLNRAVHTIALTGVIAALFFTVNFTADAPAADVDVVVSRKFSREHHRNRRVGRRYLPTGEAYHTYHAVVILPDGREKEIEITRGRYSRLRTGGDMTLSLRPGRLGLPVISRR